MFKIGQGNIGLMVYTHQKRQTASENTRKNGEIGETFS